MSHLNLLNGISKVIGHIKVMDSEMEYEPAIYIINEMSPRYLGRSFVIGLSAMQKYVNPFVKYTDPKLISLDAVKFDNLRKRIDDKKRCLVMTPSKIEEINSDIECLIFAEALCKSDGILLITSYSLAKCMRMFDISPTPKAAAQLLLFIEDSLDDMRSAPMPIPDNKYDAGQINLFEGGKKIYSGDWKISETDLIQERYEKVNEG